MLSHILRLYHISLARVCPGIFNDFAIRDAYLEIDALQCWSVSELCVLKQYHMLEVVFRREVLGVVHALLRNFKVN